MSALDNYFKSESIKTYPGGCVPLCSLILHMMTEACLTEDTLMRVLVVGLTRELPLSAADALDIADRLVARAASAHSEGGKWVEGLGE